MTQKLLIFMIIFMILGVLVSARLDDEVFVSNHVYDELGKEKGPVDVIIDLKQGTILNEDIQINYISKTRNFVSASINSADLSRLKQNSNIKTISFAPEAVVFLQDSVGIVNASSTWNLQIKGVNLTGQGKTVCIVDTGVDYTHPDLGGCLGSGCKVIGGYDYCADDVNCNSGAEDAIPMDVNGHGTHVAGIVAANGSIKGIAPDANLVAIKVCNSTGSCDWGPVIDGINWCADNFSMFNISVISISLGTPTIYQGDCDNVYPPLTNAINNAVANDIAVVAASGNDWSTTAIVMPACIENATAVGATNKDDSIWDRSNRNHITDLFAPGVSIKSTVIGGGYAFMTGTSMATPHVSAAFALIRQFKELETGQILEPWEIKNALKETGKLIYDSGSDLTFPRIDIYSSIFYLDETSPNVSLIQPLDNLLTSEKNLTFSCNTTDLQLKNITLKVWDSTGLYFNNSKEITGTFNESSWNLTNMSYDDYEWNCYACDLNDNCQVTQNYSFTIGYISTTLISPINNTMTNLDEQDFICHSETKSSLDLSNITFFLWNSSSLIHNETKDIDGYENSTEFNFTFDYESNYKWNCLSFNNNSDFAWADENFTIIYDVTLPNITLISPTDNHQTTETTLNFLYNVTDQNEIANCSLIVDNEVLNLNDNITGIEQSFTQVLSEGNYLWQINCIDRAGNQGDSTNRTLVIYVEASPDAGAGDSGGGGGGGAGGGAPPKDEPEEECEENWSCNEWSDCTNGTQLRDCIDRNACGTTQGKPTESQPCIYIQEQEPEQPQSLQSITGAIVTTIGETISENLSLVVVAVIVLSVPVFLFIRKKRKKNGQKL